LYIILYRRDELMQIGDRIKGIRKERGITQTDLALKAGISRTYLADLEGNRYTPSINILKVLANVLNVKLSDIIEGKEKDPELSESYIEVLQSARKAGITPDKLQALIEILKDK
jgi:transcriptional regulator with XRE-family HTH domain